MSDEHKITFGTLTPDGFSNIRLIKQSDIARCPHYIMVPEHYREDSTCKCDDPNETVMREWGYTWSEQKQRWD